MITSMLATLPSDTDTTSTTATTDATAVFMSEDNSSPAGNLNCVVSTGEYWSLWDGIHMTRLPLGTTLSFKDAVAALREMLLRIRYTAPLSVSASYIVKEGREGRVLSWSLPFAPFLWKTRERSFTGICQTLYWDAASGSLFCEETEFIKGWARCSGTLEKIVLRGLGNIGRDHDANDTQYTTGPQIISFVLYQTGTLTLHEEDADYFDPIGVPRVLISLREFASPKIQSELDRQRLWLWRQLWPLWTLIESS